jgi:hypothetical protein
MARDLAGAQEHQCSFLIVISMFSVMEVATFHVFQHNRIKPKVAAGKPTRICL